MSGVLSARVDDELVAWVVEYAEARGVSRQALVATALETFRRDCEAGVPEIRERTRRQASASRSGEGVGECPKSPKGHVWETVDGVRRCRFCSLPGKAYLAEFGLARASFFSNLKPPMTSGSGKPAGSK